MEGAPVVRFEWKLDRTFFVWLANAFCNQTVKILEPWDVIKKPKNDEKPKIKRNVTGAQILSQFHLNPEKPEAQIFVVSITLGSGRGCKDLSVAISEV